MAKAQTDAGEGRWMKAKFPGRCPCCPSPVEPGDRIMYVPTTRTVYHDHCWAYKGPGRETRYDTHFDAPHCRQCGRTERRCLCEEFDA